MKIYDMCIYEGVGIFNELNKCKISFNQYNLNIEDKKYLSLYLGLIKVLSKYDLHFKLLNKRLNIQVNNYRLDKNTTEYILNNYFSEIIDIIDDENYLSYLLDKKVIKMFNSLNGINNIPKEKNKILTLK